MPPAVAYAVGRRTGNAVARNRLRRRLRAAIRERAELLAPDTAYLVGADSSALTMSFAALSDAIARALSGPVPQAPEREAGGPSGPVPQAPEREREAR
jgi:ribonuclease P protein component